MKCLDCGKEYDFHTFHKCQKETKGYARSLNEYDFPLMQCDENGNEIFHIAIDGKIISNNKNITENNAAIADCFRRWVKVWGNLDI